MFPRPSTAPRQRAAACTLAASLLCLAGCHRYPFPSYADSYREFAYVTSGSAGTVTVLDLVHLRQERVLQVGVNPTGLAANPARKEIYAVNTGSDSVTVIDAEQNKIVTTIGVHHLPYEISVAPDGLRGYVANSGSNTVSVLDLVAHRELAAAATGEAPGVARIAPDMRSLVVSNRMSGSISIYDVSTSTTAPLHLRSTFAGCPQATEVAILPDSSKAFIACSAAHQVMAVWLATDPESWRGKQDADLRQDHLLTMLDVGPTPTALALKPDGGELFTTNFAGDSVSELSTWTNEVSGTYVIGARPARALVSRKDNSSLWVTNFGADTVSLYSVDDGKLITSVRTGSAPDALALSADEHALLVVNSGSGDVAVIRTQGKNGPELVTLLPAGPHPNDIATLSFNAH